MAAPHGQRTPEQNAAYNAQRRERTRQRREQERLSMAETDQESLTLDAAPPKRKRSPRGGKQTLEPRLRALFVMIGAGWKAADDTCGSAFLEQAPEVAKALNLWAMQDAKLYAWLNGMTTASGPMSVAVALMPVAQTVAVHHVVPALQRRRALEAEAALYEQESYPEPEREPEPEPEVVTANA